jgi:cytochrome c553
MTDETLFTWKNKWVVGSVAAAGTVFLASAAMGFVFFPTETGKQVAGIWDSICSAAGVPRRSSASEAIEPDYKTSTVVLNTTEFLRPPTDSIGRGATLAQQCAICHGPTGVSRADSPNLAGQYASVIYKQLHDFKSGARVNAVMSPFVATMSEQDIQDLAAYYAFLPRLPAYHPGGAEPAPAIVESGAPMRGIAPCGSCHGGIENKAGSPWLEGQSAIYIKAQLYAFAGADRRNDVSQQMRNVARQMTDVEIDQAAAYYASQPVTEAK